MIPFKLPISKRACSGKRYILIQNKDNNRQSIGNSNNNNHNMKTVQRASRATRYKANIVDFFHQNILKSHRRVSFSSKESKLGSKKLRETSQIPFSRFWTNITTSCLPSFWKKIKKIRRKEMVFFTRKKNKCNTGPSKKQKGN